MPPAKKAASKRAPKKRAEPKALKQTATGREIIDRLSVEALPLIDDYVRAVSDYVVHAAELTGGQSKQAQIALSGILARALRKELRDRVPGIEPHAGELNVAGALRVARADVSEAHALDGLRLAIEIKPINLAVGRAIWNRFGDVRAFAVNIHLKFPFAIVGGVLAVPTWEWAEVTKAMQKEAAVAAADRAQLDQADDDAPLEFDQLAERVPAGEEDVDEEDEVEELGKAGAELYKRSTLDLIHRLIKRLTRTRRRETEADAAHLLEAIAVIVYDPDTGEMLSDVPEPKSGLRWSEFVDTLVDQYDVRFED